MILNSVTLGKLLNLSMPQFPHLYNEGDNTSCRELQGLNKYNAKCHIISTQKLAAIIKLTLYYLISIHYLHCLYYYHCYYYL